MKRACILFLPMFLMLPFAAFAADIDAITKPDADVMLSFIRGGIIDRVGVVEGERVKKGTVLASQEDTAERIQLRQLKEQSENMTKISMAEAELQQKSDDLEKLEAAMLDGAVTTMEVDHAQFEVETSALSTKLARFEREQLVLQKEELQARLAQLILVSPLSGQIEEIAIEVGEAAEPLAPVIRVVKIDPLRIDAQVPLAIASSLKVGDKVQILFPAHSSGKPLRATGEIKNIAAVADAASDTLRVRIAVNNPDRRPAGERVRIEF